MNLSVISNFSVMESSYKLESLIHQFLYIYLSEQLELDYSISCKH